MSESLPPCVVLVFGRSRSGKNTFVYRYLANLLTPQPLNEHPAACVFVFDWKYVKPDVTEAADRMGRAAVTTEAGIMGALDSRLVIFNPHAMFPGTTRVKNLEGEYVLNDLRQGIRWFCDKVFALSRSGPGRKILFVDEPKNFMSKAYVYPEILRIATMGAATGLGLLMATHFPSQYHRDLRDSVTEWVCFNITEPDNLDAVRPYFPGVDQVTTLPRGSFIAVNRDNGAELAGKLF